MTTASAGVGLHEISERPLVTIGLAMRNAGQTIELAVRSMQQQTYDHWELILIDDGSTDDSLAKARQFTSDARIRLIADGQHQSLAARLNQAVALGAGTIFARMDADDVSFPLRLERQVDYLERNRDVDLVGTDVVVFDSTFRPLGKRAVPTRHEDIVAQPHAQFRMVHPTFAGRMHWFRDHRYDVSAPRAQDQLLLLSAYRHSRFANLPEVMLGYREERLKPRSASRGRAAFIRGWLRYDGLSLSALRAVFTHGLKLGADFGASLVGLERYVRARRLHGLAQSEVEAWHELMRSLAPNDSPKRSSTVSVPRIRKSFPISAEEASQ